MAACVLLISDKIYKLKTNKSARVVVCS